MPEDPAGIPVASADGKMNEQLFSAKKKEFPFSSLLPTV
jgi:hypothetical protein